MNTAFDAVFAVFVLAMVAVVVLVVRSAVRRDRAARRQAHEAGPHDRVRRGTSRS